MVKVTGNLLSKPEEDADTPSLSRHYICFALNIYSNQSPDTESDVAKKIRRRYSQKAVGSALRLSVAQIFLGVLMILCQISPSYWHIKLANTDRDVHFNLKNAFEPVADMVLPGVWLGLYILITGIIGLAAARKNARCLIVAHMVLNSFAVLATVTVVVLATMSLAGISYCKTSGVSVWSRYNRGYDYDNYKRHVTTTYKPHFVDIFGERIDMNDRRDSQRFYCQKRIFAIWMAFEGMMILCGIAAFVSTIALIVKNSKALCLCCRTCCSLDDGKEEEGDDVPLIST